MSEQEQERHQAETDESTDSPDVEAHRHDEFMRDDVARDDVVASEDRGRMDEAV